MILKGYNMDFEDIFASTYSANLFTLRCNDMNIHCSAYWCFSYLDFRPAVPVKKTKLVLMWLQKFSVCGFNTTVKHCT